MVGAIRMNCSFESFENKKSIIDEVAYKFELLHAIETL